MGIGPELLATYFFILLLLLVPAFAGTIPSGLVATVNLTNFTFAADFEADAFSARNYGIAINDSYLDVNTTYFLTVNITNFTQEIYNFTANSTVSSNPTNFTAKMRSPAIRYNLKVNGVYSREVLTDSYGNATFSYNTWGSTPARFLLATCLESWSYTQWSDCSGGTQSRTGADANSCGTSYNISEVLKSCSIATSSGGGGSGGGSLSEGTPSMKSLDFSFQAAPLLKILATVLYTLSETQNITVSYPSSIPLSVPPAPGLPYSFIEIAPTFNSSQYLTQAQIDFKVNKTWYSKNEIALGSTSLLRYDGRYWRSLPTVQTDEDLATYSFSANTTSFSLFAITGTKRPGPVPTSTTALPTPPAAVTPTSTRIPTSKPVVLPPSNNLTIFLSLLAISAMLLYRHYRPKPRFRADEVKRPLADFPSEPKPPPSGVTLEGIVTSHLGKDFEVFDGSNLIAVRFSGRKPGLGGRVRLVGTYRHECFEAKAVEEV